MAGWWALPAVAGLAIAMRAGGGPTGRAAGAVGSAVSIWLCWRALRARVVLASAGVTAYGFFRTHRLAWSEIERVALLEDRAAPLPAWARPVLVLHGGRRISLEMVRSMAMGERRGPGLATVVGRDCAGRTGDTAAS
ncbi:MAG: PH domain-containing protein [Actinomycetota bacterium]|nr:PH domain-containing protein [Actinomycetota bacterium]